LADDGQQTTDDSSENSALHTPHSALGITVATTRPETMLGDTAVAVHPDDERWKHLIGKVVTLPIMNRPIPVIADEAVEKEFGTGAVKVTPGHDPLDFEIGQRHGLPIINILNLDGTLNENAGPYNGQPVLQAREGVLAQLQREGYLVKTEPHTHSVPHCELCGTTAIRQDPDVLDTWFSSSLWPFSTLGWPDKTPDYEYFYPTSVMETGYDILFFWVARMIFQGLENTGQVPFHTVYLHG